MHPAPFREPRLLERGTEKDAEHGPGAAQAIGSLRRVHPLQCRSMAVLPEAVPARVLQSKVVTRIHSVLVLSEHKGGFFLGGNIFGTHY